MRAVAIIPARLASTRLPRKVLREIAGKPMLQRVYEAAAGCKQLDDVIVATDSEEIVRICDHRGWKAQLTSADHRSGTDRVWEVAQKVEADIYVNVQGDEPLARPEHVSALLRPFVGMKPKAEVEVSTLKTPCPLEGIGNPNAVKVVTDQSGYALYFSRATIPYDRDRTGTGTLRYFKHLGFYAYRKTALEGFHRWPESELEHIERLEQLRFLANGVRIHVEDTPFDTIGVDTEEDLQRVEKLLRGYF